MNLRTMFLCSIMFTGGTAFGAWMGVSSHIYTDVVCDNALDADLAYRLADWTPMHEIERPVMDQAISEEHQTLSCRAYARGMVVKFPASQRWVKRADSTTHKVKR